MNIVKQASYEVHLDGSEVTEACILYLEKHAPKIAKLLKSGSYINESEESVDFFFARREDDSTSE